MGKVLYGNASGYFTNCINEPDVIQLFTENPDLLPIISLRDTLERQMYLFWVVKKMSFSWSGIDDEGNGFSYQFEVSADQATEEQTVCGRSFSTSAQIINEQGGITYIAPYLNGVFDIPSDIYAGMFRWVFEDPFGRYGIIFGARTNYPFSTLETFSWNLGAYSISIPLYRSDFVSGGPGQYTSFNAQVTEWFSYGETWDTQTGLRLT
jgi:hypothetical protein